MNFDDPARMNGTTVIGGDGEKLGTVDAVYFDNATDKPEWVAVRSGLFGTHVSLVPLRRAEMTGDELRVPFDKVQLRNAPHHDAGRELSSTDEADLYRYYGVEEADGPARRAMAGTDRTDRTDRTDMVADDAMTRSEERMRVGTTSEEVGRARLRKHVVTEHQQVTVPVTHEEVRLEREPITEANRDAALRGTQITEAEHEVVLHAERPVVDTVVEPVERVRLTKDAVTEQQSVEGDVRKERIEFDGVEDERSLADRIRDHRN
jgi:uncharacterized protein (TIGR02271 family)